MDLFLNFLITGLTTGAIYALVGIGFNIVYNATSIINLAQGEFVVLGGLVMWYLWEAHHLPLLLAFTGTLFIAGLTGYLMERLTIRPLLKTGDALLAIVMTIAVSILLRGLLMFKFGKDPYTYSPFLEGAPLSLLGVAVPLHYLSILLLTALTVLLLYLFFNTTLRGLAMRACSVDPQAAKLLGIKVESSIMLAFIISAAIGAVGGIAITPVTMMEYDRGPILSVKGFCVAIIGGLGKTSGALIGGLILGVLESLFAGYLHSGFKDALALITLILLLVFKPTGLLGRTEEASLRRM